MTAGGSRPPAERRRFSEKGVILLFLPACQGVRDVFPLWTVAPSSEQYAR
jgi:hypothetical protein